MGDHIEKIATTTTDSMELEKQRGMTIHLVTVSDRLGVNQAEVYE